MSFIISDKLILLYFFINLAEVNNSLIRFLSDSGFTLKIDEYQKYIRSNKTSYFWNGQELIIKGNYKYIPKKLEELQKKILQK